MQEDSKVKYVLDETHCRISLQCLLIHVGTCMCTKACVCWLAQINKLHVRI